MRSVGKALAILALAFLAVGCASPPRDAFTADEQRIAVPIGFAGVRVSERDVNALQELRTHFFARRQNPNQQVTFLSISGGGANGAYGAGILYGWTESGQRPRFDIVAGVSTGALAAPFAFLGPAWDDRLKAAYTGGRASTVLKSGGFLQILSGTSFFSAKYLRELVNMFVGDTLITAVAKESTTGRALLVTTTNLDTQEMILWDMGAIARIGGPQARQLFRQVLLASASVPGVFPPVMIEVEANGRRFAEMHVDGGAVSSFFAVPEPFLLSTTAEEPNQGMDLYVLVNGTIAPEFEITPLASRPIVMRSYDTVSKAYSRVSLAAVAAFGRRNNVALHVTAVPPGTTAEALDFNQAHMIALFELGRRQAADDQAWREGIPQELP